MSDRRQQQEKEAPPSMAELVALCRRHSRLCEKAMLVDRALTELRALCACHPDELQRELQQRVEALTAELQQIEQEAEGIRRRTSARREVPNA